MKCFDLDGDGIVTGQKLKKQRSFKKLKKKRKKC